MIRRPPSSPLSPYAPLFGSLAHGLADLDGAAGQPPLPAVGALLQKEPTATIEDDRRRARPNAQGPLPIGFERDPGGHPTRDRKSTRLNSSHSQISYAGFCLQ